MLEATSTPAETAPGVLNLSKIAWRIGISISRFEHDDKIVVSTIKDLAGELKSLGNECDSIYSRLEAFTHKIEINSPPSYEEEDRVWACLAMQVKDAGETVQELEEIVKSLRINDGIVDEVQRLRTSDRNKTRIAQIRTKIWRHSEHLRATMQLIETALIRLPMLSPGSDCSDDIEELENMVRRLEASPQTTLNSGQSQTESTLVQYVRDTIERRTSMYKGQQTEVSNNQGTATRTSVNLDWISTLADIRKAQHDASSRRTFKMSREQDESKSITFNPHENKFHNSPATPEAATLSDSDDDLDVDLARAALSTGTEAFAAKNWDEANSLLREATRIIYRLSDSQKLCYDTFDLHHKLSTCAFYILQPDDAEQALLSLFAITPASDEERKLICNATHLLAVLYIQIGQLECARSECEKALQSRRRLQGKRSEAALESLALLAHVHVLFNNRALAKSCLSIIPDEQREAILINVEKSIGDKVEHLDFASLLAPSNTRAQITPMSSSPSSQKLSRSTIGYIPGLPTAVNSSPASPDATVWGSPRSQYAELASPEKSPSNPVHQLISVRENKSHASEHMHSKEHVPKSASVALAIEEGAAQEAIAASTTATTLEPLSRKEILQRMGCQPKDKIEEVVVAGDIQQLTHVLQKKKGFWRSTMRKHSRPERVTALHFAALFGEVEMAQHLLNADFNINEIPFGYSTSLSPLHFAIGARQADMVQFLLANGARPTEPDTWSSLAGQMLTRSWLSKTMSYAEKQSAPGKIVAIMRHLIEHGWNINVPMDSSGKTILHQAVAFWTGDYTWDLDLRIVVADFLCENKADPGQPDKEGKTPYGLAVSSGHQELIHVLETLRAARLHSNDLSHLVELPAQMDKS